MTHVTRVFELGNIENESFNSSLISKINVPWIKNGMINFLSEYHYKTNITVQLPCYHPNDLGHKLWGEEVVKYMKDNILYDKFS